MHEYKQVHLILVGVQIGEYHKNHSLNLIIKNSSEKLTSRTPILIRTGSL